MRPSVRRVALTIGCATLAAGLVVLGPRWWVATAHGHRTVERVLNHILHERVPGTVTVGRLGGDVWAGLRASDVVIRNPDGTIMAQARFISARWQLMRLLARRELEEVRVERPVLTLERARWLPSARTGEWHDTFVKLLVAHDGQVRWKSAVFTGATGTASLHSSYGLEVHQVAVRTAGNVLQSFGRVGWGGQPTWVWGHVRMTRPGQLRGRGGLFYRSEHLALSLDELEVAAPMAARVLGGQGPVRMHGQIQGTTHRLQGTVIARQDERSMHLQITFEPALRAATVAARIAGTPRPIDLQARICARAGRVAVSALHATVGHSRVDGSAELARRHMSLALRVRLLPSEAPLLRLRVAAPLEAQLWASGRAPAFAVRGHASLEAARLSWRGRVNLRSRSGALHLLAHAVQPARFVRRAPALTASGTIDVAGRLAPQALVGRVRVVDGAFDAGGLRLSGIVADTPEVRIGREGEVRFRQASGRWKGHRFTAQGTLAWNGRTIEVRDVVATAEGAQARVDARYQLAERHLSLRAAPLSLSRQLVSRLLGRPFPRPWHGQLALEGGSRDVHIGLEAVTSFGMLRAAAQLVRMNRYVDLRRVEAQLGDSHLSGALHYQGGRIDASVQDLVLSPTLVHQLAPKLNPAWPIRLHGALAGQQVLTVRAEVAAGPSTARISGRIAGRQFQLAGYLDAFDYRVLAPHQRPIRGTLELAADGRIEQGGVVGALMIRDAHGFIVSSPFYRGSVEARLEGRGFTVTRAAVHVPGARVVAQGSGSLDKGTRIDYGVVVTNAFELRQVPQGLRALVGINSILPGRSVKGAITKQPGQPFAVSYHVLPIGIAQLEFLYRVITGRYWWSETRWSERK
jgi:hypothetical protein